MRASPAMAKPSMSAMTAYFSVPKKVVMS
jgi:hypothetical protein